MARAPLERTSLGGIVEAGVFTPHGVGTNALLSRDDDDSRSAVRLETTWTLDLPERLATLRLGDTISASGAWGRSVRFGGVQFGTNFATQPTLVTTPMLAARGSAVVPSTVDVFVNGAQVASQDVPPGPFTIDHVPSITGAGQMQVVITDALGRQQVLSQPYYTGPALLRAGLNEYSFELGSMREDYGYASNVVWRPGDRGDVPAWLQRPGHGRGACGSAGRRTGGGRPQWRVADGEFGILSATMAAGGADAIGWLAGFGFEHNGQRSSLFARTQFASESFCAARHRRTGKPAEAAHLRRLRPRLCPLRQPAGRLWPAELLGPAAARRPSA
ncbi:MAG: fimbrial biogenesis outer membrane usher protein [Proteobacteria bacterium]|nr:fimbrial biogenesis outer membrane usher protein [Pseudomonadota bacterium]